MMEFARLDDTCLVATVRKIQTEPKEIQPDSLLEDLYTHYSLHELQSMSESAPVEVMLLAWDVNEQTYYAELKKAIELVKND